MESPLKVKSYAFALRVVKASKFLNESKEYVLSKQLLRSGAAIGALIQEAEFAQSPADFISKMSISLKEANETAYWLSILKDSDYIGEPVYKSMSADCSELIKMLVSSVKTAKNNKNSEK
jgi:four helix bundle protein